MRLERQVFAVVVGVLFALGLGTGCSSGAKNASADVTVSRCEADPSGGQPAATGNINNHSSKTSGYAFQVTFVDSSGNKVTQGFGSVASVPAGATATWSVGGIAGGKGPLSCKVSHVVRTAVP